LVRGTRAKTNTKSIIQKVRSHAARQSVSVFLHLTFSVYMLKSLSLSVRFRSLFSFIRRALNSEHQDFTAMPVNKAVLLLAVPMVLELCMESVFALVDIFFVNRWLGNYAVTAVGLTESVVTIVYSLAIGLSMAATAMVARRIGEKDPDGAAHAALQSLWIALAVSVLITMAGLWYAGDILTFMGAESETVRMGTPYTRILLGGNLVIVLLFLINGIFRGAGDAAMAMRSLWIANLANIILCPICIKAFGLPGAAIATTTGRGIGVAYQVYHLFKGSGIVKFHRRHLRLQPALLASLAKVGAPGTLQFIIASGSWIVLARLVAETGHADASAGYQTAIRVLLFFLLPAWGLSNAATTLVGQHLGAKQPALAEQSVLVTARYNIMLMLVVSVIFVLFAGTILGWFTQEPNALRIGATALRIIGAGSIFYGAGMVFANAFNGAGDTRTPTVINFVGFWLVQVPVAWWLARGLGWGPLGVFIAVPTAEGLIALVSWLVFRRGRWKEVKV